jgi:hypothetical protein
MKDQRRKFVECGAAVNAGLQNNGMLSDVNIESIGRLATNGLDF